AGPGAAAQRGAAAPNPGRVDRRRLGPGFRPGKGVRAAESASASARPPQRCTGVATGPSLTPDFEDLLARGKELLSQLAARHEDLGKDLAARLTELSQARAELGQTRGELSQTRADLGQARGEVAQSRTELTQ